MSLVRRLSRAIQSKRSPNTNATIIAKATLADTVVLAMAPKRYNAAKTHPTPTSPITTIRSAPENAQAAIPTTRSAPKSRSATITQSRNVVIPVEFTTVGFRTDSEQIPNLRGFFARLCARIVDNSCLPVSQNILGSLSSLARPAWSRAWSGISCLSVSRLDTSMNSFTRPPAPTGQDRHNGQDQSPAVKRMNGKLVAVRVIESVDTCEVTPPLSPTIFKETALKNTTPEETPISVELRRGNPRHACQANYLRSSTDRQTGKTDYIVSRSESGSGAPNNAYNRIATSPSSQKTRVPVSPTSGNAAMTTATRNASFTNGESIGGNPIPTVMRMARCDFETELLWRAPRLYATMVGTRPPVMEGMAGRSISADRSDGSEVFGDDDPFHRRQIGESGNKTRGLVLVQSVGARPDQEQFSGDDGVLHPLRNGHKGLPISMTIRRQVSNSQRETSGHQRYTHTMAPKKAPSPKKWKKSDKPEQMAVATVAMLRNVRIPATVGLNICPARGVAA